MHRLPSETVLRRFRIAAVLVILMWLSVPVTLGLLVYGIVSGDYQWLVFSGIAVATGLVCAILNFMMGGRLRCPLCMVPPLQNRSCSKHRTALRLFGSHRLKVAHSILFKDHFRCPYCGEPTAMEVRERHGRRR